MCTEHFIKQESTCAHTPQQHGIAEKRLAVLEADAKCMCSQANLPVNDFWGYAYKAANHVRNRLLSKVEGMPTATPYERRTGIKPDMTRIRVFGCVAYVHHPSDARKKPDMRATRGIFVGYREHKKGWIVLDPVTGKEMVHVDVVTCALHRDSWRLGECSSVSSLCRLLSACIISSCYLTMVLL